MAASELIQARENICALILELSENPKPDYNVDGQSVKWGTYLNQLLKAKADLDAAIAAEQPFELHSIGLN